MVGAETASRTTVGRGHVRFGSKADMAASPRDVRFIPDNGHSSVETCRYSAVCLCFQAPSHLLRVSPAFTPFGLRALAPLVSCRNTWLPHEANTRPIGRRSDEFDAGALQGTLNVEQSR